MAYHYQPNDNIFDIESLQNLYVDTHYFPNQRRAAIYYLSDVNGYQNFDRETTAVIKAQILKRNYHLRKLAKDQARSLRINFYNLRRPANLQRYCLFWGLTPSRNSALNYVNAAGQVHLVSGAAANYANRNHTRPRARWVAPEQYDQELFAGRDYTGPGNLAFAYYTVKRTDPMYRKDPKRYGITMGFNSDNYDLTMIAAFLGTIVHNRYARNYLDGLCRKNSRLNLKTWSVPRTEELQSERDDLLHRILTPEFLRRNNDRLFTRYKRTMPQLLQHQPDLQSQAKANSSNFFARIDNPAYWIYKGWLTSNRYLDVANLNEHMKFVPLKRIAGMKGWQILESKHVTANTKLITNLTQLKDLIAYNNSDVQVTKQVFELPEYQDALTLRRILLKKYPQLTYTFNPERALSRYQLKSIRRLTRQFKSPHELIPRINRILRINQYSRGMYPKIRANADPQDVWVASNHLRFSPLTDDASSAKLISNVIAPYHAMQDWPDIEFEFPDPRALKIFKRKHPEIHLEHDHPFNVLEDTMGWCRKVDRKFNLSADPPADATHVFSQHHSLAKTFRPIYDLYKTVEGHNVNLTLSHLTGTRSLYNIRGQKEKIGPGINMTRLLHQTNGNIPYLHRDGSSTGTIATFSYGGIHGVEFKLRKFKRDYRRYLLKKKVQSWLKTNFRPKQVQISLFSTDNETSHDVKPGDVAKEKQTTVTINHHQITVNTKDYVKGNGDRAEWRDLQPPQLYKHPQGSSYILNDDYSYVSVDRVSHEDFSGYYPMLISRLGIMWPHDEPVDEYHHIYVERLRLKHQLKKYRKNSHDWNVINIQQLLRKLLLNSASGAGDAKFSNTIRMNNKLVSMRIMGQLFTWRMAQSVCLADQARHAKVTSSNTDGVYLAGLPGKINDVALQRAVRPLSLFISPVPLLRFVSKDANNRAEVSDYGTGSHHQPVLTEAKGATLNAWQGPSVMATVSHPAIVDYVLAHYLAYQPNPCNQAFDRNAAMKLIDNKRHELFSDDEAQRADGLIFFQWIIASNPNKHRYPFLKPESVDQDRNWVSAGAPVAIPHTNRLFLIKSAGNDQSNRVLLLATRQKLNRSTYNQKMIAGEPINSNSDVIKIFASWRDDSLPVGGSDGYENHKYVGRIAKLPDMPNHQNVLIENHSLFELTKDQVVRIAQRLDYGAYLGLVIKKYHASWDNQI